MVDYTSSRLILGERNEPIKGFEVWFRLPNGLYKTFEAAAQACVAEDWPINSALVPVSVVIGESIYEEIGR